MGGASELRRDGEVQVGGAPELRRDGEFQVGGATAGEPPFLVPRC